MRKVGGKFRPRGEVLRSTTALACGCAPRGHRVEILRYARRSKYLCTPCKYLRREEGRLAMGLSYQVIPHNSSLLERARHDSLFATELEFLANPDRRIPKSVQIRATNKAWADVLDALQEEASRLPWLRARYYEWEWRSYKPVPTLAANAGAAKPSKGLDHQRALWPRNSQSRHFRDDDRRASSALKHAGTSA
jgi:hypothetical protein